ncbi:MAG: hypothetical protein ACLU30_00535 [Odoribacter splanchnicus]
MVAAVFPSFPLSDVRPSVRYPCSDKFPECGGKRRIATFMYGVTYLVTLCKFGGFYIFRFPIDRFYSPIFIVSSLAPSVKRMVGGAFQLFIHALRSQIDDFIRRMAHCAFHGVITSVCSQYFIPNPDFIYRQETRFVSTGVPATKQGNPAVMTLTLPAILRNLFRICFHNVLYEDNNI